MVIHRFDNGDIIEQRDKALIVRFSGARRVLSTSPFNGGVRDDLKYGFNHDCKEDGKKNIPLKAPTYAEHMRCVASVLGLDPLLACGLSTAADMENVAVAVETYLDTTVTAVVTGGIDVNGGRVGDTADWHETDGVCVPVPGTINIMLFISACLPEGTLARALVTCTEAKTAALQELLAPSAYSSGIATGSGTDGTMIVSDLESPVILTYAGKHAKLGELIGRTVMTAVKKALFLQTGLAPAQQFDVFSRIGRYGVTKNRILSEHPKTDAAELDRLSDQNDIIVMTSLYVHLLDQLAWGLITAQDAFSAAAVILESMGMGTAFPQQMKDAATATKVMLNAFTEGVAKRLTC